MVVRISIVYMTNIELAKVDCQYCVEEIRLAENQHRKMVFRVLGTTRGSYCDHYFLHYKNAKTVMDRENEALFIPINR
jgi:hypothetical protein